MNFGEVAAVLGWIGTILLLAAYGLVSTGRIPGDRAAFQVLNVGGSTGLGIAAIAGGVWSAATLNAIWVAIGLVVLVRLGLRRASSGSRPSPGLVTASEGPEGSGRPS